MADGSKIPENIADLIRAIGYYVPDDANEGVREVMQRALENKCMTCEGELGENTMVLIHKAGIGLAFCCGACMTDMQIVHWLQEQVNDVIEQIDFRGGSGDVAVEEEDDEEDEEKPDE